MAAPVEVTTNFATTVDDLPAAWAFVMERIDKVGESPSVTISPIWVISVGDAMEDRDRPPRQFEVVVSGMVPEPTEGAT